MVMHVPPKFPQIAFNYILFYSIKPILFSLLVKP
jgi:hypothetical protein